MESLPPDIKYEDLSPLDKLFYDNIRDLQGLGQNASRLWGLEGSDAASDRATTTRLGSSTSPILSNLGDSEGPISDPKYIGSNFDELSKGRKFDSPLKRLNLSLMRRAVPDKTAAIVAAARDEGPYLIEWIAHNMAIGFEKIVIYSNDNSDHSSSLLWLLHKAGIITYIENSVRPGVQPQIKALEHSVHFLRELRRYRYVAYFDLDEFLVPDQRYDFSIVRLLSDMQATWRGPEPGALFVHWDWYGSDGRTRYDDAPIQERFVLRRDYATIKSIVNLAKVSHIDDVHIPDHDLIYLNSSFDQTSTINYASQPIDYSGARLNHYFHKSFEEYAIKRRRGSADPNAREFDNFFQWEPIEGVNGTRLGTPKPLIDRVKTFSAELRKIPGVAEIERQSVLAQRRIASTLFDQDLDQIYTTMKHGAARSGGGDQ